jgi:hypothetical protein
MARCCVIKDATGKVLVRSSVAADDAAADAAAKAGALEALKGLKHPAQVHIEMRDDDSLAAP